MSHLSSRRSSAFSTPQAPAPISRRLLRAATALAAGWMLAACGGGGADSHSAAADAAAVAPSASAPDTAASTPSVAQPTPAAVVWNTSDKTTYQLKSPADLGLYPQALNQRGVVAGTINTGHDEYAAIWHDGSLEKVLLLQQWGESGCYKACSSLVGRIDEKDNLYIAPAYYGNTTPPMQLLRRGATRTETLTHCLWVHAITSAGTFLCEQWTGPLPYDTRSALWHRQTLDKTVLSGEETAINTAGTLAGVTKQVWYDGSSHFYLFRQKDAGFIFLELPGVASALVNALNDQDVMIGTLTLPEDNAPNSQDPMRARPFMWKGAEHIMLPCPETYGQANDINREGLVVGTCFLAEGSGYRSIAVLWKDGQLVDLNARLSDTSGWNLISAQHLNNQGLIIASGYALGESTAQSVLLTPQP